MADMKSGHKFTEQRVAQRTKIEQLEVLEYGVARRGCNAFRWHVVLALSEAPPFHSRGKL